MTMVRKKQAEIEKNIEMKDDEDLLSLLLKSFAAQNLSDDEKLSNDELVSAIFIIFFAGFETSSTSLNFFLRILATHPDVQERLIEEIDSNINSIDSMTFEDLTEKLPLMNSFIKESFRVKPAVGAVARTVLKKEGESIGKIHLEKGSVLICNMMVHHQLSQNTALDTFKFNRYYQDPTLEEKIDRGTMGHLALDFTKDDLIPFSLGPRDCLGKRMALIEIKVILVFLLKQFRLKVPDHLKESQSKIKEGYFMTRTTDSPFILDFETR
ncbi:predicted protein [Naegleria gruberi]|uniref:Predicted protein n=1 Tax=Naegleria gruberi TaxID=5762 RepID=D2V540_NAEGR|nr:uncharacterized protein NAEGRDRAFT_64005 [Naegleria gruberi]EFC48043.1 predicted protein [Naegleria gruberi]|eukprot:XP_002680787.1 predicted protein [Naegleria gruberi strain NEG-M]